jgi:membrane-associated phospholipid phosphatase
MNKTKIAQLISTVGHPFVMIVLLVLLLSWAMDPAGVWRITGFVAAMGMIPTGWLAWRSLAVHGNRGGTASTASMTSVRPILYLTLLGVLLLSSGYFHFVERAPFLARGSLVAALMVAVAAMLNRWLRLSLHLVFAVYSGLILVQIHSVFGVPILLLLAPLLAWSRLVLLKHTLPEVIGGAVLGFGSAIVLTGIFCKP